MLTEQRNPVSEELDTLPTLEILRIINRQDAQVPVAIAEALPTIAAAVDLIVQAITAGHRLFYMGAGTSGRLGVLDASELFPTFSFEPDRTVALIAGGPTALTHSVEASEDSEEQGCQDLIAHDFGPGDVLIGLAASGRTPYVLGGMSHARDLGAATIALCCNPGSPLADKATVAIEVLTGPEVIAGSTRMKAGTAQKLVLNMLSTTAMVRLGKVYGNLMVDVRPTNSKLQTRAVRIVAEATGAGQATAQELLQQAGWDVKVAVVMGLTGASALQARDRLAQARGYVRDALTATNQA